MGVIGLLVAYALGGLAFSLWFVWTTGDSEGWPGLFLAWPILLLVIGLFALLRGREDG